MTGGVLDRDFRTRSVLAPVMLLAIGGIYALDYNRTLGLRQGMLSAVLLGVLGVLGVHEYTALMQRGGFAVARWPLLAMALAMHVSAPFFGWHVIDHEFYPLVLGTLLLLFPLAVWSLQRDAMQRGLELQGGTLLGFCFISWPLFLAQGTCFRCLPSVLFVVLVCKGGDIGAYVVGRLFGRRKLIPHVSPGKTWEGMFGSLLFSVALSVSLRSWLLADVPELQWPGAIPVGVMLNLTTQTGDLVESLLKRRCGAKDSSALLPSHGGILDLLDSLLFSFCAWFLVLVVLT